MLKNIKGKLYREMELLQIPTDKEIRVASCEEEEAIIQLFQHTIGQLAARLQALEDRVSKNSRNCWKPPSSDGLSKPFSKSLRKRHPKKSVGQPGHEGHTLKAVHIPDFLQVYQMQECHTLSSQPGKRASEGD